MPRVPKNMEKRGKNGMWYGRYYCRRKETERSLHRDLNQARRIDHAIKDFICSRGRFPSQSELKHFRSHFQWPTGDNRAEMMTFGEGIDLWHRAEGPSWSPNWLRDRISRADRFLKPQLGGLLISELAADIDHLWGLREHLQGQGYKLSGTVRKCLDDVRRCTKYLIKKGILRGFTFPEDLIPEIPDPEPKHLTYEELALVCSLSDPLGFVCRFLFCTGLRWGDATRARVEDIEGNLLQLRIRKNGKILQLRVPSRLLAEIRLRVQVGKIIPYSPGSNPSFIRDVRKKSGVEDFTIHRMRWTHARHCRLEAMDKLVLQHNLGHRTSRMPEYYAPITDDIAAAEVERVFSDPLGAWTGSNTGSKGNDDFGKSLRGRSSVG